MFKNTKIGNIWGKFAGCWGAGCGVFKFIKLNFRRNLLSPILGNPVLNLVQQTGVGAIRRGNDSIIPFPVHLKRFFDIRCGQSKDWQRDFIELALITLYMYNLLHVTDCLPGV